MVAVLGLNLQVIVGSAHVWGLVLQTVGLGYLTYVVRHEREKVGIRAIGSVIVVFAASSLACAIHFTRFAMNFHVQRLGRQFFAENDPLIALLDRSFRELPPALAALVACSLAVTAFAWVIADVGLIARAASVLLGDKLEGLAGHTLETSSMTDEDVR